MRRRPAAGRAGRGRRGAPRRQRGTEAPEGAESGERLQKLLARAGLASRREAEGWIRAGRLTINGALATLGARATPQDEVRLDGRVVRRPAATDARAFVCHRSPGEALRGPMLAPLEPGSEAPRLSLIERLPRRAGRRFIAVSPMPRVDGGLELVSSDGELAARLQRAMHDLVSEFGVRVRGELNPQQLAGILEGTLDSGARLVIERLDPAGGEAANRWYSVSTRGASGKEMRQLFERQGALVSRVLRTQLGPVRLERSLGRGQFRELTQEELRALLASAPGRESG